AFGTDIAVTEPGGLLVNVVGGFVGDVFLDRPGTCERHAARADQGPEEGLGNVGAAVAGCDQRLANEIIDGAIVGLDLNGRGVVGLTGTSSNDIDDESKKCQKRPKHTTSSTDVAKLRKPGAVVSGIPRKLGKTEQPRLPGVLHGRTAFLNEAAVDSSDYHETPRVLPSCCLVPGGGVATICSGPGNRRK